MDLCSRCGYLLIFRNYGANNPHQPFHVPSGWHCWKLGQEDSARPAEAVPFPEGGEASETYWNELALQGLGLFRRNEVTSLRDLVRRELQAGNRTMAGNLVREIVERFPADKKRNSILQQLMALDEWQCLSDSPSA